MDTGPSPRHLPVLLAEVLKHLELQPGDTLVDATLGGGGHAAAAAALLGPTGRLIGLDRDPSMLARARLRLEALPQPPRFDLLHASFADLRSILDDLAVDRVDAVLADLGFASDHIDDPSLGLGFAAEGPLDMRLNPHGPLTAADLLADLPERELADLFWKYGEERFSRRIARRIVTQRDTAPLRTTAELAQLVRRCVPRAGRIDPATRVFQALRIAVNDEQEALAALLADLPRCLRVGGRAVIISFHSLEDRPVKHAFRDRLNWQVLTKKPVTPNPEEIEANPRSRSAKLRAAIHQPALA
ncbi:MAG TPA: 16S rRNA (cytosine(1402)-N(4))-methyltransferase RsmH [Gemmatales bacterium]|nr:16S rRNA (cytosine(1402)-N(4))-methyltransferase RsmH [Gemmatales bacterium]